MDKDDYLIRLSESERTDFGRVDFDRQSEAQKVFSAICEIEGQVNNGGFEQYFFNSDSDMIAHAPEALVAVGALRGASIVKKAIRIVEPLPASEDERRDAVEKFSDAIRNELNSLDSEFFRYPDDLTDLLFRYVSEHPEEFGAVASDPDE